jgi:DNA polymerase elongation subunit (family B)
VDQQKIVKQIIEESKKIEMILNGELLGKFGELHNVSLENNKLFLKQEIVAKRGYFFDTKKKYALNVISKEGVDVDELVTIGLVTRRSDYPSATKEKVQELLNLIIMSEEFDIKKIRDFVYQCRTEMYKLCERGDKSVGRPATYTKDLNKYIGTIPHHIKAMELWNKCEYDYFTVGSKGYIFRIKGIDLSKAPQKAYNVGANLSDKSKYIALPYEEEKLPDYFILDVGAMMKFSWSDRESELLYPIKNKVFNIAKKDEGVIKF